MRLVWGQGWQAPLSVPSAIEGSARFIFRINLHDELFIPPGIQGNDKVLRAKLCWSQAESAGLPDVDLFRPAPRRCLRGLPVPAPTKDGVCAMDHSILASCLLDRGSSSATNNARCQPQHLRNPTSLGLALSLAGTPESSGCLGQRNGAYMAAAGCRQNGA